MMLSIGLSCLACGVDEHVVIMGRYHKGLRCIAGCLVVELDGVYGLLMGMERMVGRWLKGFELVGIELVVA